jgi:hypothetical protein
MVNEKKYKIVYGVGPILGNPGNKNPRGLPPIVLFFRK